MKYTCSICNTSYDRQVDAEECEIKCQKAKDEEEYLASQLEPRLEKLNADMVDIEDTYGVQITMGFVKGLDRAALIAHRAPICFQDGGDFK